MGKKKSKPHKVSRDGFIRDTRWLPVVAITSAFVLTSGFPLEVASKNKTVAERIETIRDASEKGVLKLEIQRFGGSVDEEEYLPREAKESEDKTYVTWRDIASD